MKRFEDDDFDDNIWSDDDEDEVADAEEALEDIEEYQALVRQQLLDERQYDLIEHDTNQRILKRAIKVCSASWFWRFRTLHTKLKLIKKTYAEFVALTRPVKPQ